MILLRHWREKRGYSVRDLARRAGVTHVSIVRIENGQASPNVAMLEKLAEALGVSVRDFFPVERLKARRDKR
jgi:transcriptional regulator with XRE-family HTH domain